MSRVPTAAERRGAATSWIDKALGIHPVWSIWLATVVAACVLLRVAGGPATADLVAAPLYLIVGGVISFVYALALNRRWKDPALQRFAYDFVIVPAILGLVAASFGGILYGAILAGDPAIVTVGLPVIFLAAPSFGLFAIGYTRGDPSVGAVGYKWMVYGLGAFAFLAIGLLAGRALGAMRWWDGLFVPVVVGALLVIYVIANVEYHRAATKRPATDVVGERSRRQVRS